MKQKTKKNLKIGIWVLAILLVLAIIFSASTQSVVKQGETITYNPNEKPLIEDAETSTEIYTINKINLFLPQRFATSKNSWVQGEDITIENIQDMNFYCVELIPSFMVRDSENNLWIENDIEIIRNVGYMAFQYKHTISGSSTRDMPEGTYKAQIFWVCDGKFLNLAGTQLKSSPEVDNFEFTIMDASETPKSPKQCFINTCQPGEKLVNEDSRDCFCERQYVFGDGNCDIGENSFNSPKDCGVTTEDDCKDQDLILVERQCVNPDRICQEDGGNINCNGDGNSCGAWLSLPTFEVFGNEYGGQTIIPDLFCIINGYFLKLRTTISIIAGILASLFAGFSTRNYLEKNKKKNKDIWIPIVVGIVVGLGVGYLVFVYFWAGLITLIILGLIKGFVPGL